MDLQLAGKRAIVTGSTIGIGESIARALADEGVTVVVHGRDEQRAKLVASDIVRLGHSAYPVTGDIGTDEGAAGVCRQALERIHGIEILVNNVGSYEPHSWTTSNAADWAATYNTNVLSAVRMGLGLLPQMKTLGWGRIIHVSSALAARPLGVMPDYSAAKAALLNVTASLALELAGTGITVNAVVPGLILTPGSEHHFRRVVNGRAAKDGEAAAHPSKVQRVSIGLGRPGTAEEVASLVVFLCSPLAGYIHGAALPVDGGFIGPAF